MTEKEVKMKVSFFVVKYEGTSSIMSVVILTGGLFFDFGIDMDRKEPITLCLLVGIY